jgi:hypothetical protein
MKNQDTLFIIRTKYHDPTKDEDIKVTRTTINNEELEVNLKFNVRQVEKIEVKPIKRPIEDIQGHVDDAERLANESS